MPTKHGEIKTRLYHTWGNILYRCRNQNASNFKTYGGRGINVCKEWESYINFRDWALQNGYKDGLSIERVDVNGNYCPENCKWITALEQQKNRRDSIFFNGEHMKVVATRMGISVGLVYNRIRAGWSVEKALFTPKANRGVPTGRKEKITYSQANEIRNLVLSGKTRIEVAKMFGISKSQVGNIASGRSWIREQDNETAHNYP